MQSIQNINNFSNVDLLGHNEGTTILHENVGETLSPKETSKINEHRLRWHFLTLGVPLLLETLSVFCKGIIHRHKSGLPLRVRFKTDHLTLEKMGKIALFQRFTKPFAGPLHKQEEEKATLLIQQTINACNNAKDQGDFQEVEACQQKLQALGKLLEKNRNSKMSRNDFDEDDWRITDQIDYELADEHGAFLTEMFNSDWFKNAHFQYQMKRDFGVDYDEAVLAELLSFSLAYVEGLDQKTLRLPVYDADLQKYRTVAYVIKASRMGDDLPCYLLESNDPHAHPWFVIRGTQSYTKVSKHGREHRIGSFESMMADTLDHKCISRNILNKALIHRPIIVENGKYVQKESLEDLFGRCRKANKKVNLCGHSLGGTLVNTLAVEFYDQIKTAYAFSAAGVSKYYAGRWEALNSATPAENKLINFDHEGDIVPAGGRCLIGNHVAIEPLNPPQVESIYQRHNHRHLCKDFQIQKVDAKKENGKFERAFCERIRIIIGACLRFLFSLFNGKYLPDWWCNRKIYRERANLHRLLRPHFV